MKGAYSSAMEEDENRVENYVANYSKNFEDFYQILYESEKKLMA